MNSLELSTNFYRRAVLLSSVTMLVVFLSQLFGELSRDLWIDELLLAELTRPSVSEILGSTLSTANHSPIFLLYIKAMRLLLGDGALQLRLSSLIPSLLAACFCFRICRKSLRLDVSEALFCVTVFCLLPVTVFGMTNFRPYGPALLGITAALYFCLCFRESGRVLYVALSAGALAIAVYCQYVYGLFAFSLLFLIVQTPPPHRRQRGLGVFLVTLAVFISPVFMHAMDVAARSPSLSIFSVPGFGELLCYVSSSSLIFLLLLSRLGLFYQQEKGGITELFLRLSLFTFFAPLAIFYLLGVTTGISLFLDRYIFWTALPFVFLFGRILVSQQGVMRIAWMLSVFLTLSYRLPPLDTSRWHKAHTILAAELTRNPRAVVVAQTAFIEANNISLLHQEKWKRYFLSPLRYYGYEGDALILPLDSYTDSRAFYISQVADEVATSAETEIILLTEPVKDDDAGLRFVNEMLNRQFVVAALRREREIYVYQLRRLRG